MKLHLIHLMAWYMIAVTRGNHVGGSLEAAGESGESEESREVEVSLYRMRCLPPKNHGKSCKKRPKEVSQRFYYDIYRRKCRQLKFYGCGGNANNFGTREECEATCSRPSDFCTESPYDHNQTNFKKYCLSYPDVGRRCVAESGLHVRVSYYYNASSKTCKMFEFLGCDGNYNQYATKDMCERTCIKHPESSNHTDNSPPESGSESLCKASYDEGVYCYSNIKRINFTRYYFNETSKTCQRFTYKGCGGNSNKYHTLRECKDTCRELLNDSSESDENDCPCDPNKQTNGQPRKENNSNNITPPATPSTLDLDDLDDTPDTSETPQPNDYEENNGTGVNRPLDPPRPPSDQQKKSNTEDPTKPTQVGGNSNEDTGNTQPGTGDLPTPPESDDHNSDEVINNTTSTNETSTTSTQEDSSSKIDDSQGNSNVTTPENSNRTNIDELFETIAPPDDSRPSEGEESTEHRKKSPSKSDGSEVPEDTESGPQNSEELTTPSNGKQYPKENASEPATTGDSAATTLDPNTGVSTKNPVILSSPAETTNATTNANLSTTTVHPMNRTQDSATTTLDPNTGGSSKNSVILPSPEDRKPVATLRSFVEYCLVYPQEGTPCNTLQYHTGYYYDAEYGVCRRIYYSGCDTSYNYYPTLKTCKEFCEKHPNKTGADNYNYVYRWDKNELCLAPLDPGMYCHSHQPTTEWRYHFNHTTKTCERFKYGGCGGNMNKYRTESECLYQCRTYTYAPGEQYTNHLEDLFRKKSRR